MNQEGKSGLSESPEWPSGSFSHRTMLQGTCPPQTVSLGCFLEMRPVPPKGMWSIQWALCGLPAGRAGRHLPSAGPTFSSSLRSPRLHGGWAAASGWPGGERGTGSWGHTASPSWLGTRAPGHVCTVKGPSTPSMLLHPGPHTVCLAVCLGSPAGTAKTHAHSVESVRTITRGSVGCPPLATAGWTCQHQTETLLGQE